MTVLRLATSAGASCTRALSSACKASAPALASGARAYTNIDIYTETEHLNPVAFQQYLQKKDREFKEFLSDECDMIATESFPVTNSPLASAPLNGSSKAVNEQFAKQISDLLNPSYGASS
ncbi:hypothetical protein GGI12_004920 [Dipsacomyces acuminosporus]|nr:hypothetical protein GGI12_004920 [Dipsacomyces acuminosporus]